MEASPADTWRCCSCHPVKGAPHGCSGDVLDQLKQNASRKIRRRRNSKTPIERQGAGGTPKLRTEASKPEEIQLEREQEKIQQGQEKGEIQQEQEELDFSALLARRQQFVEEIRRKRFHPKKKFRPKKKGYVLDGLPSWLFADADDNPMSSADFSKLTCEDEDNAEDSLHVAEEDKHRDKELLPSCAVHKYDVEEVDKIAERSCDLLTTLVEKNTEEFFSGEGITDYLRPQPLLALDNVTHTCILTKKCYHRTYRTDDITETDLSYRELEPENMVQIFSLTLPRTYPRSVSIYGIFAIRDVLHPGRNYLFRRSRDNSITIHPRSTSSPKGSPATKGPAAKKQRAIPKEKQSAAKKEASGSRKKQKPKVEEDEIEELSDGSQDNNMDDDGDDSDEDWAE